MRLRNAGAVLIGATNVPIALGDWQSYNQIYGTTRSVGCGANAGKMRGADRPRHWRQVLGYLSVGSDIGGSIRVPAHFCGVYGHKPTLDLIDMQGHLPGGQHQDPGFSTLLAVGGPLARSAEDLLAALRFLGGPADYAAKAWKWELPPARHESLREFRIGYVLDDPYVTRKQKPCWRISPELEKTGATLKCGWPQDSCWKAEPELQVPPGRDDVQR